MIEVSKDVCELLLLRLQEALEGRPELRRSRAQPGLKLLLQDRQAHLSLAFPSNGDEVVSYKGRTVLIIPAKDLDELAGARLLLRQNGNESLLSLEKQAPSVKA